MVAQVSYAVASDLGDTLEVFAGHEQCDKDDHFFRAKLDDRRVLGCVFRAGDRWHWQIDYYVNAPGFGWPALASLRPFTDEGYASKEEAGAAVLQVGWRLYAFVPPARLGRYEEVGAQ
jgi:hypothetical protein